MLNNFNLDVKSSVIIVFCVQAISATLLLVNVPH